MISANPLATIPEIGKMLGEAWHGLTEPEKNKYRQKAQALHNVSERTQFL